jgi:hypothetical protein
MWGRLAALGDRHGVPNDGLHMRDRRAATAEERANQLPVKMLGPLDFSHCHVAGNHPADDVPHYRSEHPIGGQADSKLGVKPLMRPRPLTFAMLAGKLLFLDLFPRARDFPATPLSPAVG